MVGERSATDAISLARAEALFVTLGFRQSDRVIATRSQLTLSCSAGYAFKKTSSPIGRLFSKLYISVFA